MVSGETWFGIKVKPAKFFFVPFANCNIGVIPALSPQRHRGGMITLTSVISVARRSLSPQ